MYNYLYFILHLLIGAVRVSEVAEETLVLVHAVFRHGARTPDPISTFPNDLYKNVTYYPYGEGELNQNGIKTSYQLGKELRRRYDKFLGPKYHPEMLEMSSSGFRRCRMTAQLILAGMFPPHQTQTFEEGLSWQPIPYKYINPDEDQMISFMRCMKFMFSLELRREFNQCVDRNFLYNYLTKHSGMVVQTLGSVFFIFDTLKTELENGLSLPSWAKPIWPEPLYTCNYDFWRHFANNKTVLGVMGGLLMKKILEDTKEKISKNSLLKDRKLYLYIGHEHNIYIQLGMLNCYNNTAANYLAHVFFEVHKIDDIYGFKVYWNNRDEIGLTQLEIPECGFFCPVDKFNQLMEFYVNSQTCP